MDKVHVFAGDADNFFLNNSTRKLQEWMKKTEAPHYEGFFAYGATQGHCWAGPVGTPDRLKAMAEYILGKMPPDSVAGWWKQ